MRYATHLLKIEEGHLAAGDPFAAPMPVNRGHVVEWESRRHRGRMEALHRVYRHNVRAIFRNGRPFEWMVAIELDPSSALEAHELWLDGENGVVEMWTVSDFRFIVPSETEAELLEGTANREPRPESTSVVFHMTLIESWLPAVDWLRGDLRESVQCYRRRLYRPAAVMLGCLAEKITVDLLARYERVIAQDDAPAYRQKLDRCFTEAQRFGLFCRQFNPGKYGVEAEAHAALRRSFDVIRRARNRGCHPARPGSPPLDREQLANCYEQMAEFCAQAYGLIGQFERLEIARPPG